MGPQRVVSRDDVVRGGCRFFLEHATIDMDALARTLSISRATLYRVVHGRDGLLGDVLWRLCEQMLSKARRETQQRGVDGVLEITRRFSTQLLASPSFREFLASDAQTAARVLFTAAGGVHGRAIAIQKEIFLDMAGPDDSWAAGDLDQLAYLYVRIIESMLYAELLTGRQPDIDLTERAARALLEAQQTS